MSASLLNIVRRYGTLIGFAIVVAYFWTNLPDTFLTARNLLNISQQMSMLAVVAFTMTVVMAMGDFDLSVGAMASLAGIVAAIVFVAGGAPAQGQVPPERSPPSCSSRGGRRGWE